MIGKISTVVTTVLVSGLLALPAMAQSAHQYQGGPKTPVPHTMTQTMTSQPQKPAAEQPKGTARNAHRYRGGPSSPVLHETR
jgi:hypothetical protein